MYDSEDILDIEGSINANLIEENGWWGFINGSNLNGTFFENKQKTSPKRLNINLPLNDRKECEFVDMYPDRSLFPLILSITNFVTVLNTIGKFALHILSKTTINIP